MLPAHLAEAIRRQVLFYLQSTFDFRDREAEKAFSRFLLDEETGLFKGPWVQLQRPFRPAPDGVDAPFDIQVPFHPFVHQWRSWQRLTSKNNDPQPTIVTTGTGSGKTECFLYPILDHCLRARRSGLNGIKAMVLYPMNALAADQERRIARAIWNDPQLKGAGIRVGNYTGRYDPADPGASKDSGTKAMGEDHGISNHQAQQDDPPDILLTNYKMLDFLLLRPQDRRLWRLNQPGLLRYLVMDELHTYDGAQGADVACLIRRLKERLGIGVGELCVVGTSATLESRHDPHAEMTDAMETGTDRLARFASTLFEENIPVEAVIPEDRLEVEEIVRAEAADVDLPEPAACDPREDEDALRYAQRQAELWGGPRFEPAPADAPEEDQARAAQDWSLALGEWLKGLKLFKYLLDVFEEAEREGPLEWARLIERLGRAEFGLQKMPEEQRGAVAVSLFAMVAQAKEERSGTAFPLVPTQVQLWVRELRRLGRAVSDEPRFVWLDEPPPGLHALPAFHCSECGDSGWIAMQDPSDDTLIQAKGVQGFRIGGEPTDIYNAWFRDGDRRDQRIVVISPWDENAAEREVQQSLELAQHFLCPHSLIVRQGDGPCPLTGDARRFRVNIDQTTRTDPEKGTVWGEQGCPACGSREGIFIIGSQAATLSSVAIDELFGSVLNSDPKLLAFTDSVQDASHRAGFFSARTYNFSLRTALQHVVDAAGSSGVTLKDAGRTLLSWWSQPRPGWKGNIRQAMAAFLPPELRELHDWVEYREEPKKVQPPTELLDSVAERISWQITSEFGVMENHGRSLEASGASCLEWDSSLIDETIGRVRERLEGIDPALVGVTGDDLQIWLLGVLHRYRLKGALDHRYVREAARTFWGKSSWGKPLPGREVFPPRGRFPPRLMVTRKDRSHEHVLATTSGAMSPWHVVWARRALNRHGVDEASLLDLMRQLLVEGTKSGLFVRVHQDGQKEYYSIAADAAHIVPGGQALQCSQSGRVIVRPGSEASLWNGGPSLEYRAEHGRYSLVDLTPRQLYYCDRYRKGALRRVVAEEHTGLLTTEERERVERLFSSKDPLADDPNVLACTSTLEMGIDIGDLSSTMLCSVPPTTASYLQRIGRAGRATGTALIVAVVNQKPHDLFFYARPDEMLRGRVDPPGCWLDASAVLVRQYLAYCFDSAVRTGELKALPSSGRQLVEDLEAEGGQIPSVMAWVAGREAELRQSFLNRFVNDVQDDTRERFVGETAAELLLQRIHKAGREFDRGRKDLENARNRLKEQLAALDRDEEEARAEIERELKILKGRISALSRTSALEILTDHGLLPNYAFPERGVRFYGAIYNRHRANDREHKPIEVTRSAKAALKELAPANHFYTHSRMFDIQQIAVGSKQQPLVEEWAVCGACGHMRRAELLDQPETAVNCPQCGHGSAQADQGQRRRFVEFSRSQALSYMEHYESLSADRSEERQREFYQVVRSFDLTLDAPSGAVGEDDLPFGIEYRSATMLREVNVGYQMRPGIVPFGPGQLAPDEGFRVCLDCGMAVGPRDHGDEAKHHRRSCSARRKYEKLKQEGREGSPFRWESVYLYRELRSEAIRVLLPLTDDEDLETLAACIYLGLRLRFEGNPANLRVVPHQMPDPDGGPERFYLVIMDEVPGGTGYLKTLYQEADGEGLHGEGFMDVLRRAKATLETCPCRRSSETEDRDGCYRCIRAYHLQYRADQISRERGIVLLEQLIAAGEQRQEIEKLEDIKPDSLIQSVLERKFVEKLRAWVEDRSGQWEQTIIKGARGYRFRLHDSDRLWEIEAQPKLGPAQGVVIPCQPDFMLRCDDDQVLPIAVFTDGFQYHCHPHNRIADDMEKRRAILDSGSYHVWSITWDDVIGKGDSGVAVCPDAVRDKLLAFARARRQSGAPMPSASLVVSDSFRQLMALLDVPDEVAWRSLAEFVAYWPLQILADRRVVAEPGLAASLHGWRDGGDFATLEGVEDGTWVYNDRASSSGDAVTCIRLDDAVTTKSDATLVLARLGDGLDEVEGAGFKTRWRRFLAVMNLYQFWPGFTFWASSEVAAGSAPDLPLAEKPVVDPGWSTVFDEVIGAAQRVAVKLAELGAPLPEVATELPGLHGEAFAEMAWPDLQPPVAVLAGDQQSLSASWQAQGWVVFELDRLTEEGLALLTARFGE